MDPNKGHPSQSWLLVQPSTGPFVPRCGKIAEISSGDWDDGGRDAREGHQAEFVDICILHGQNVHVMKIFEKMQATNNQLA